MITALHKNTPGTLGWRHFRHAQGFRGEALRIGNTPIAVSGTLRYLEARGPS
jgi:hypothetical protein